MCGKNLELEWEVIFSLEKIISIIMNMKLYKISTNSIQFKHNCNHMFEMCSWVYFAVQDEQQATYRRLSLATNNLIRMRRRSRVALENLSEHKTIVSDTIGIFYRKSCNTQQSQWEATTDIRRVSALDEWMWSWSGFTLSLRFTQPRASPRR